VLRFLPSRAEFGRNYQREKWSGIAYEKAMLIAEENNLYVKWNNGWVKCSKKEFKRLCKLKHFQYIFLAPIKIGKGFNWKDLIEEWSNH